MEKVNKNLYKLAPQVFATVFPEIQEVGNGGIIVTDEGVILIDTDVRTVDAVSAMLPELTDKPVKFLINSHHAFDHSSANCIWAARGVTIIGSEPCREAMIAHGELNFRRWSDRIPEIGVMLKEKAVTVALPQLTFDHEMRLYLGGKEVRLSYHGHAHSPGDIVIHLPREEVIFGGDLLWVRVFPNVREAKVPNQLEVIDYILSLPVRYYVPGHGEVTGDRQEIEATRDFIAHAYDTVAKMVKEGKSYREIQAAEESLAAPHPDWEGRSFVNRAIEVIHQSLTVKGDA